ncbi:uncharacterized protein ARMOST_05156 [Armillaria ostoyae]|uniref:Uncharacterized protein n=1 Tax=Armillaria ostoyae TaxID=47428 RepID=A0A284QZG0_ARMOS|nr:uncharacterized protein ARMOST_05156 [Armillaria ostoyae]
MKKLVRINQGLQEQVEHLQSGVNEQPKKTRGRSTGLDSRVKQLEEKVRFLEQGRKKDKKKISALRALEAKAEAKDLVNGDDSDSGSADFAHQMRKLLRRHNDIMLVTPLPTNEAGISKGADETVQCPQCRKVCSRDDVEIVYMTETERWDRLLEVAQAWGAMDRRGEEETSEEEAQEDIINDGTSSVSSPSNDANTAEEEDDMISKNGEDSDGGANPSTVAQAPSPSKVKRERLAHLAEERRKKRRLV